MLPPGSKTEKLRSAVTAAADERSRLEAMLALAAHLAEVSDGVNGLEAAREARSLALRLDDRRAVARALNSASVSQYHRSDYVSALATAMDAWDCARQADLPHEFAHSYFTIGLALHALGEVADGLRVVERGLALVGESENLREPRVLLVGLKAMFCFRQGRQDLTDRYCAEAIELSVGAAAPLLALNHGNWGIASLRAAEQRIERGEDPLDLLARARRHLEIALELERAEDDVMRVVDTLSLLGQVAWLDGRLSVAEALLAEALQGSLDLDFVRTIVRSAWALARLYLARGDNARAIEILRIADAQGRRGAPADSLPALKLLLADALERNGDADEAAAMRDAAAALRKSNELDRARAGADAQRLAARMHAAVDPAP